MVEKKYTFIHLRMSGHLSGQFGIVSDYFAHIFGFTNLRISSYILFDFLNSKCPKVKIGISPTAQYR